MGTGLIWLTSVGGYIGSTMLAYRFQYIRTYKRYRKWQNKDKNGNARLDYGGYSYGFSNKARKDVPYWDWFKVVDYNHKWHEYPPYLSPAWPLILMGVAIYKTLHPTVKVSDPKVVESAEKDIKALAGVQRNVVDLDKEIAKAEEAAESEYDVGS